MTALLQTDPTLPRLPTEDDLPDTDHQPVDNELQLLVPFLLQAILLLAWAKRRDWFMGVNLGVYPAPRQPAIGPDAFLALGVERIRQNSKLRKSYVVWQEGVIPQWVLEVVSQTPGGEYDRGRPGKNESGKLLRYAEMGVLYYTIYNPTYSQRDGHDPFEVYRLIDGIYVQQTGNPVWMPEIGLGIGTAQGNHKGYTREWLYWYDEQGNRYPVPETVLQRERQARTQLEQQLWQEQQRADQEQQRADQEQQRAEQEQQLRQELESQLEQQRQRVERLAEQLRALDIDPEKVD